MNCDEVRERLPWLDNGSLDAAEARAVEEHLAGCPDCQAERAETRIAGGIFATAAHPSVAELVAYRFGDASPEEGAVIAAASRDVCRMSRRGGDGRGERGAGGCTKGFRGEGKRRGCRGLALGVDRRPCCHCRLVRRLHFARRLDVDLGSVAPGAARRAADRPGGGRADVRGDRAAQSRLAEIRDRTRPGRDVDPRRRHASAPARAIRSVSKLPARLSGRARRERRRRTNSPSTCPPARCPRASCVIRVVAADGEFRRYVRARRALSRRRPFSPTTRGAEILPSETGADRFPATARAARGARPPTSMLPPEGGDRRRS